MEHSNEFSPNLFTNSQLIPKDLFNNFLMKEFNGPIYTLSNISSNQSKKFKLIPKSLSNVGERLEPISTIFFIKFNLNLMKLSRVHIFNSIRIGW